MQQQQQKITAGARTQRIHRAYVRTYSDSGQIKSYVEWCDGSRTEGDIGSTHMRALMDRFVREGGTITQEVW